jgi:hypothetical protein
LVSCFIWAMTSFMGRFSCKREGSWVERVNSACRGLYAHGLAHGLLLAFGSQALRGFPLSPFGSVAHLGPHTMSVRDTALALTVMSQPDARDWTSLPPDGRDHRIGLWLAGAWGAHVRRRPGAAGGSRLRVRLPGAQAPRRRLGPELHRRCVGWRRAPARLWGDRFMRSGMSQVTCGSDVLAHSARGGCSRESGSSGCAGRQVPQDGWRD